MRFQATLSQVGRDHRSEMIHPTPNGLVGHRHSAFRQQVLDVTQAEGEPQVEPYRLVNDLRWEPVSSVADLLHPAGYRVTRRTASPSRRDDAFRSDGDDPEGADSKDRRTRYPRTGDLHYRSFRYRRIKEIGSSLSPSSHLLRSSLQQSHFWRDKTRARIKDPALAELLAPT